MDVASGVDPGRKESAPSRGSGPGEPLRGEPIMHFARSPGRVEVELENLDSLVDWDGSPNYPHTRPMLNTTVTKFMIDTVREDRGHRDVEIAIALRGVRPRPEDEMGACAKLGS